MSTSRYLPHLLPALGLASVLALSGCWTEETPAPPPKPAQTEVDDGAAAADDDAVEDEGVADDAGDGDAAIVPPGSDVNFGTGTGLSSGGADSVPPGTSSGTNRTTSGTSSGKTTASNRTTSGTSSGKTTASNRTTSGSSTSSTTKRSSGGNLARTSTSGSSSSTGSNRTSSSTAASTSGSATGTGNRTSTSGSSTASGSSATGTGTTAATNRTPSSSGTSSAGPSSSASDGMTAAERTAKIRASSGTSNDGVTAAMAMDAFDQGEFDAAPGVRRFSGSDWKSLREERVLTVMNEPGPGTDPSCYPRDMLPLATKGKLTKDQTGCIQKSLSQAEYAADQARLSLVLISNAQARQEADNWSWLVQRHLEVIDEENPGLSYRYALHLYEKGPASYPEALRYANMALGQRAAWSGDVYHERVTRLYKLRAAVSQAMWKQSEDEWAESQTEEAKQSVLEWRETTRKAAVEWHRYAAETGMDTSKAYSLCVNASIQEGCEGVDAPPS